MDIKTLRNKFKRKTKIGYPVRLLTYHPLQEDCIFAEVFQKDRWNLISYDIDGSFYNKDGIGLDSLSLELK